MNNVAEHAREQKAGMSARNAEHLLRHRSLNY